MQRQVYWWTAERLPDRSGLEALEMLDGIFMPEHYPPIALHQWQTRMAPDSEDLPLITFADQSAQKNWIHLTMGDDYWMDLLPGGRFQGP
jgi:hypothetical protein